MSASPPGLAEGLFRMRHPERAHPRNTRTGAPAVTASHLGRRYWRLWGAATGSSLGDGIVFVAFPLLAASVTRDPRLIAGVAVVERLPWLLVSLAAGAMADRSDRRKFLMVVESA